MVEFGIGGARNSNCLKLLRPPMSPNFWSPSPCSACFHAILFRLVDTLHRLLEDLNPQFNAEELGYRPDEVKRGFAKELIVFFRFLLNGCVLWTFNP